jgi:hypothetical protein
VEICSQLIAGVSALHAAGIIHRDLKPNNVMLERTGQRLNVSIMDFGLARLHQAESSVLGTGMIAGTPGYMAPELLRGERPTKATDIFALGIVLHQVLTGERPIESERGLSFTPSPLLRPRTLLPSWFRRLRVFSVDPERRCRAFERLRPAQESATPAATFSRSSSLHGKWMWYWAGGALAVVAVGRGVDDAGAGFRPARLNADYVLGGAERTGALYGRTAALFRESRVPSEMAVSGGMIAPMPQVEPGMRLMDISADGAKVLEWKPDVGDDIRRGSLWMASSLGGAPRRLGNYLVNTPEWGAAGFSPDGQSIVFTDKRMLYAADANGDNVKKIWEAPNPWTGCAFRPTGGNSPCPYGRPQFLAPVEAEIQWGGRTSAAARLARNFGAVGRPMDTGRAALRIHLGPRRGPKRIRTGGAALVRVLEKADGRAHHRQPDTDRGVCAGARQHPPVRAGNPGFRARCRHWIRAPEAGAISGRFVRERVRDFTRPAMDGVHGISYRKSLEKQDRWQPAIQLTNSGGGGIRQVVSGWKVAGVHRRV